MKAPPESLDWQNLEDSALKLRWTFRRPFEKRIEQALIGATEAAAKNWQPADTPVLETRKPEKRAESNSDQDREKVEASRPVCRPDVSGPCYAVRESPAYAPRNGRPCPTSHHLGLLPRAGCHARWTVCANYTDPDEEHHSWTAWHWHPYATPSHASAVSHPHCPTATRSGGRHGLRVPGRARVPAVKATMGSRSNFSCCSSHTPNIYKNSDKGTKPAA